MKCLKVWFVLCVILSFSGAYAVTQFNPHEGIREITTKVVVPDLCETLSKVSLIEPSVNEILASAYEILEDTSDTQTRVVSIEQSVNETLDKACRIEPSVNEILESSIEILEKTCMVDSKIGRLEEIEFNESHCPVFLGASDFPLTISSPGYYVLCEDVSTGDNVTALTISSDHVIFDFNEKSFVSTGGFGAAASGVVVSATRCNIVLKNGTVDRYFSGGIIVNAAAQNIRIERMLIKDSGHTSNSNGHGIRLITNQNVKILYSDVTNSGGAGLFATSCSNLNVVGSSFLENDSRGVFVSLCNNGSFSQCRVNDNKDTGGVVQGDIVFDRSSCFLVIDCEIHSSTTSGGTNGLTADLCSSIVVDNCFSCFHARDGFLLNGSRGCIIKNSVASNNNRAPSVINSNGILVQNGFGNLIESCTVTSNKPLAGALSSTGINIENEDGTCVLKCIVKHNKSFNGALGTGISVSSTSDGCFVQDNTVVDNATGGIVFGIPTSSVASGNISTRHTSNYVGVPVGTITVEDMSIGFSATPINPLRNISIID